MCLGVVMKLSIAGTVKQRKKRLMEHVVCVCMNLVNNDECLRAIVS